MQLCMFINRIGVLPCKNNCEGNEEVDNKFKH